MLAQLKGLFSATEAAEFRQALRDAPFEDGKNTARGSAKAIKNNLQLNSRHELAKELSSRVRERLDESEAFQRLTWPAQMQVPRFCKYEVGMGYGEHVDLPTMGGRASHMMRTDISMTMFFTPLDEYEGGELVFQSDYGSQSIRGAAGDAVIYPSTMVHRVAPVTKGERLVAITWIESKVRDAGDRKMLYDMGRALAVLEKKHGQDAQSAAEILRLRACLYQLTRRWLE